MKKLFTLLFILGIWISPATSHAADKSKPASPPVYVITNDDGTLHTYASFYLAGGTQNDPTLTFQQSINTQGLGIGGGFFGTPRLAMLPNPSTQCLYVSDAGTGDIAGINIQSRMLAGNFSGSSNDIGTSNGIGMAMNQNYLYAGYSLSNTIATFSVGAGCTLSFLGDITVTP